MDNRQTYMLEYGYIQKWPQRVCNHSRSPDHEGTIFMDTTSVPKTTRLQRGVRLYQEHGHEIERIAAHTYRVPSCSGEGSYIAYTDLRACTCPDHARAKAKGERCKHFHAAYIVLAKRRAARARRIA